VIIVCAGITDVGLVGEVKLLATVAAQAVEDDGHGGVRIARRAAAERVISTLDPESRHGQRSRRDRYDGYKLYISVHVDSDLVVVGRATTATTGDGQVLNALVADDPVAVAEVVGDTPLTPIIRAAGVLEGWPCAEVPAGSGIVTVSSRLQSSPGGHFQGERYQHAVGGCGRRRGGGRRPCGVARVGAVRGPCRSAPGALGGDPGGDGGP
jgi:hypothetical protein